MSESLSQRIAKLVQTKPARQRGLARVAVVALRDDIQKALDDGWSVMDIWRTLHAEGSIKIGYHSFRRHVARVVAMPRQQPSRDIRPTLASGSRDNAMASSTDERSFQHSRIPEKNEIY